MSSKSNVYKSLNLSDVIEVRPGTNEDTTTPNPNVKRKQYGTNILRRTCLPGDFKNCVSLILPSRSFDIQCLREEDFKKLYSALKGIWEEVPEEERPKLDRRMTRTFSLY
jgi:hypothetical protein